MASKRVVVASEIGGLGNRFKAWASALRMSPEALVHWPVNDVMPAGFSELFVNGCHASVIPPGAEVYTSWRLHLETEDLAHLPRGFSVVGASSHPLLRGLGKGWWNLSGRRTDRYRYMVFPKSNSRRMTRSDGRHIDLEYERVPPYFRELYSGLFQRIGVRPEIDQRVERWARANLDQQVVGVQVRSWRDDRRRHRKYHLPAMQRLHALMRAAADETRFLVVSDSDQVVSSLAREYGRDRVLQFDRSTDREASWSGPAGIIEDLIDMLLLARCERIFASYLSTFSEAAWWFGGAKAQVAVF
ncbi:MAG: hypothetical protein BMS9Abin32_113 [Gammaproteobacteria bacterium]|nr:MAG: hypothetical protein BMS9Abin32_113 [Gammaproteobacteria bacterium]